MSNRPSLTSSISVSTIHHSHVEDYNEQNPLHNDTTVFNSNSNSNQRASSVEMAIIAHKEIGRWQSDLDFEQSRSPPLASWNLLAWTGFGVRNTLYYHCIRVTLAVCMIACLLTNFIPFIKGYRSTNGESYYWKIYNLLSSILLFCQGCSLLLSLGNKSHFKSMSEMKDEDILDLTNLCWKFMAVSTLVTLSGGIWTVVLWTLMDQIPALWLAWGLMMVVYQLIVAVVLSGALFSVLASIRVCRDIVALLISRCESQDLTLEDFVKYRERSQRHYTASKTAHGALTVIAGLNVLGIILMCYFTPDTTRQMHLLAALFLLVMKEIVFFCLIFYKAIEVNEMSDSLVHKLSRGISPWRDKGKDFKRITIQVDCRDNPISFRLAGMRMTRKKAAIRIAVAVLSVCVGILNSIVKRYTYR